MTTRSEFIEREIIPALGDYANEFDVEGICDAISTFDPRRGYVRKDITGDDFWDIIKSHDLLS